jgi:protein TonB
MLLSVVLACAAFASSPQSPDQWPPAGVTRIGDGVSAPELTYEAKPRYTAAAMDQKIEGIVEVEAVIESDGTVGEVKVVRSLDAEFGLDEEAVKAVKKWLFKPGKKDGVAVPVLVNIEMTFTLRK